MTPPLFYPNFGGVPVIPDRLYGGLNENITLRYSAGSILTYVITVPEPHRQTDGQTT